MAAAAARGIGVHADHSVHLRQRADTATGCRATAEDEHEDEDDDGNEGCRRRT
jgi:hypothetical protein